MSLRGSVGTFEESRDSRLESLAREFGLRLADVRLDTTMVPDQVENLWTESPLTRQAPLERNVHNPDSTTAKMRPGSVKLMLLDLMRSAGPEGATSGIMVSLVLEREPGVARETVRSLLSRLKVDGALVYVGDRYYESQFAPGRD